MMKIYSADEDWVTESGDGEPQLEDQFTFVYLDDGEETILVFRYSNRYSEVVEADYMKRDLADLSSEYKSDYILRKCFSGLFIGSYKL